MRFNGCFLRVRYSKLILMHAQVRLQRFFGSSGKCLNVALDHGIFNEGTMLEGIADLGRAVQGLAKGAPDAIQLSLGQAHLLETARFPRRPALALRIDVANVYHTPRAASLFDVLAQEPDPVLPAVQWDAACVVLNLLFLPGESELQRQTIQNIARVKPLCERYGMPLMVEPLVMTPTPKCGYTVEGDVKLLAPLVRQARELGADLIKADPTDPIEEFPRVLEAAGCPVLARGGGKDSLEAMFTKADQLLRMGSRGLVYDRNIFQQAKPAAVLQALQGMVQEGWLVERAIKHEADYEE